jgi:HD-like signal output (HDOD) protein
MALWVLVGLALVALGVWWWQASAAAHQRSLRRDAWDRWHDAVSAAEPTPVPGSGHPLHEASADSVNTGTQPAAPVVSLFNDRMMTPETAARLAALADSLPRPRAVLTQLLQSGDDPVELARVVATDPATAAQLLRTVNSAQFQLAQQITSVQHAVTYLGANLVRDIAIRHALAVPPVPGEPAAEHVYQQLWRNSYLASAVALVVARQQRLPSAAALSTQALLFSLGDIALVAQHPQLAELYSPGNDLQARVEATQQQLALNSAMAAAHLGRVWQLPQDLVAVLGASLEPVAGGPQRLSAELLPGVTLGYFATRLAEVLLQQSVCAPRAAVDALLLQPQAYFLPEYLAACGVVGIADMLEQPAVTRRLAAVWSGLDGNRRRGAG